MTPLWKKKRKVIPPRLWHSHKQTSRKSWQTLAHCHSHPKPLSRQEHGSFGEGYLEGNERRIIIWHGHKDIFILMLYVPGNTPYVTRHSYSCTYILTHLTGQNWDVVPLWHFPVKRLKNCDGSILGVDVVESLWVCVLIYCISMGRFKKETQITRTVTDVPWGLKCCIEIGIAKQLLWIGSE